MLYVLFVQNGSRLDAVGVFSDYRKAYLAARERNARYMISEWTQQQVERHFIK
jgi:hypothetical protein